MCSLRSSGVTQGRGAATWLVLMYLGCMCAVPTTTNLFLPTAASPTTFGHNDSTADSTPSGNGEITEMMSVDEPGDVNLGGLFMIHQSAEGDRCGALASQMGIHALEAMLYTIDLINNSTFLPGFKLGVWALDDCNSESMALEQCLRFVQPATPAPVCAEGEQARLEGREREREDTPRQTVAGVVGSASSFCSITVANLLKLFKIPQISYWSTSPDLSNTKRFPYFYRAVPSDEYQAHAMVDIVLHFNWTYVSIVYDNSNYGVQGIEAFNRAADANDVCVAAKEMIPRDVNETAYDRIVTNLLKATDAKAVILWTTAEEAAKFFRAVGRRANAANRFVWIGSDSWSGRQLATIDNERVVEGAITLQPMSAPIPGFDEYFTQLNPLTNTRNPWFKEFWESHFNCHLGRREEPPTDITRHRAGWPGHAPYHSQCREDLRLGSENNYYQEGQVQFVADSVWAFAHALRNMHAAYCTGEGLCEEIYQFRPTYGPKLKEFLQNVTFEAGISGNTFKFTPNGDGPVHYKILNFQQVSPDRFTYVEVGNYYRNSLQLNDSTLRYNLAGDRFPKSSCWRACRPNEMKFRRDGECCYSCLLCQQYEYLTDEHTCTECPSGTKPTANLTQCMNIGVGYIQPNTTSAISALAFATIGELATVATAAVYVRHRDTPVVKASGRELSGLLLTGVFMCYALTYLFLMPPTNITCGLQQFLMGVSFALCYASLLVKTNRVYRIFTSGRSTTKRPTFISPLSQIVITLVLVAVQGFLSISWLAAVPPEAVKYSPTRGDVLVVCNAFLTTSSLFALAFPLILLVVCTAFAFMTRKIPGHFNETKCIGFTMYSSCIIWLAMIPIYVLTVADIEMRIVSLYIAISLCATVCLVCLFLPRIYLILLRPERNVRITVTGCPRKLKLTGSVYPNSSSNASNNNPYSNGADHARNNTL